MNKLLLIIDMQEGFRSVESKSILPNILKLIEHFNSQKNNKIVFSKFNNSLNSRFETQLNWTKFQSTNDTQQMTELKTAATKIDSFQIIHTGYTVLNSELKQFLKINDINQVYLCGVYTDVCIAKTAMDLFDENIESFVIKNACNSLHGKINHDSTIDSLKHIIGKAHIISTNDLC
ncbi:MAG: cysteine hydrolase [Candidatus Diapherotrites archaeon]|nr:cysteine hydrolase [Candidatus Diapherotrites archaeon]